MNLICFFFFSNLIICQTKSGVTDFHNWLLINSLFSKLTIAVKKKKIIIAISLKQLNYLFAPPASVSLETSPAIFFFFFRFRLFCFFFFKVSIYRKHSLSFSLSTFEIKDDRVLFVRQNFGKFCLGRGKRSGENFERFESSMGGGEAFRIFNSFNNFCGEPSSPHPPPTR